LIRQANHQVIRHQFGRMVGMKQFSLRDLLFLIVIVALALGWWLDRRPIPARFQMESTSTRAYVLDTATGQVWFDGADGFSGAKITK
jgi:hypothetical protein